MPAIKVLIADNQFIAAEGLKSLVQSVKGFSFIGVAENSTELYEYLSSCCPDVLIIDHASSAFQLDDISKIRALAPGINILAIIQDQTKMFFVSSIKIGVTSILLKNCDREEIIEAIYSTSKAEKFYCSKVLDVIVNQTENANPLSISSFATCEGINISDREEEIIKFIAEGYSNKQIADLLFLSPHTINTHRKNIMNKIGVNNTAGIVIYAIKKEIISPNKYLFSSTSN
ncbi:MAG: response regulator transcription factor [Bacteroidetes bacterium]|nr:response regulator transcription factor [Bacteroidota bacterium]HET6244247.1 response regulator transcription factor [Bacteroidia bacterium]